MILPGRHYLVVLIIFITGCAAQARVEIEDPPYVCAPPEASEVTLRWTAPTEKCGSDLFS